MSYDINSIESLDFREGVRRRINMYLGTNDNEGCYQALKEIINNSTDEALAGYGTRIEIYVSERDNNITVRDFGRGVPFGMREDGENVLVSIYTKSHTGGKFNHSAYKNSSGLNGMGASCVCLSSEQFNVNSYRDGRMAIAHFEKGILQYYDEQDMDAPNGTSVSFTPDKEVFCVGEIQYSFDRICADIKDISYLYNGITFVVENTDTGVKKTFCAKDGILDFIRDNMPKPLMKHVIRGTAADDTDEVEIAFQWGDCKETSYVFVNGLRCPEGGSPITGAKTSITKVFNNLAGTKFEGDLIRANLFFVINCKVENPSFANQTKTKINNPNLRTLASNAFTSALKEMKIKYPTDFEAIVGMIKQAEKAEKAAERSRQEVLNASKEIEKNQKRKVIVSDKLRDARQLGQDAILLVAEGNSAMGGLAQARDVNKYGILALRGKLINCLSNDDEDIFKNEEIKLLLSAMNIVPGKYKAEKLRYGKIAICVDADSDK